MKKFNKSNFNLPVLKRYFLSLILIINFVFLSSCSTVLDYDIENSFQLKEKTSELKLGVIGFKDIRTTGKIAINPLLYGIKRTGSGTWDRPILPGIQNLMVKHLEKTNIFSEVINMERSLDKDSIESIKEEAKTKNLDFILIGELESFYAEADKPVWYFIGELVSGVLFTTIILQFLPYKTKSGTPNYPVFASSFLIGFGLFDFVPVHTNKITEFTNVKLINIKSDTVLFEENIKSEEEGLASNFLLDLPNYAKFSLKMAIVKLAERIKQKLENTK